MGNFNILSVGQDISWSSNLIECLNQIEEEYVLLCLDDLPLMAPVDSRYFKSRFELMKKNSWDNMKLIQKPVSLIGRLISNFTEMAVGDRYRFTAVYSLY